MVKKVLTLESLKRPSQISAFASSKRSKRLFYLTLGLIGLEMYSNLVQSKIDFYFVKSHENIQIIQNCKAMRNGKFINTFYLPTSLSQISTFYYFSLRIKIRSQSLCQAARRKLSFIRWRVQFIFILHFIYLIHLIYILIDFYFFTFSLFIFN